ncbi:hypothetical protein HCQ94_03155 [Actinomyces sp. zg-332]|uniref:hypothetical protein n=1 Tax=Actinomyces sp. zg-332 TaxID=2708340 RepID=UPI0014224F5B|nr:hypothetical protein [Actinomyces sp. zg-332]QPK93606.1 hypothetical protein HCQ94_03155 [Actinomyces sp. zg-332]
MLKYSEFQRQGFTYFECDFYVEIAENKTMVLPKSQDDKEEIFKLFGLDANLGYKESLKLLEEK